MGNISIRNFNENDVPYKVKWINDPRNNKYLHYDLPLREDKTLEWFKTLKNRKNRIDYTILFEGEPVGLIGLLDIDPKQKKGEYYICIGEQNVKGKGVATKATNLLISKAKTEFSIDEIYLYTETGNHIAQKLFEKVGFKKEKLIKNDLFYNDKYIDRYKYFLNVNDYFI